MPKILCIFVVRLRYVSRRILAVKYFLRDPSTPIQDHSWKSHRKGCDCTLEGCSQITMCGGKTCFAKDGSKVWMILPALDAGKRYVSGRVLVPLRAIQAIHHTITLQRLGRFNLGYCEKHSFLRLLWRKSPAGKEEMKVPGPWRGH